MKVNILCSYAYVKRPTIKETEVQLRALLRFAPYANLLIDSGAYTNFWNRIKSLAKGYEKVTVSLPEYIEAAKIIDGRVWGYITLDVPHDPLQTQINLNALTKLGLKPMPVFVESEDWSRMPKLIEINPRVCVAGAVQTSDKYTYQRYQLAWEASEHKIEAHALGFGRWPDISALPIKSADSSTWINGSRFGAIMYFRDDQGLMTSNRKRLVNKKDFRTILIFSSFKLYNVKKADIDSNDHWRARVGQPCLPQATHTWSFLRFIEYVRDKYDIEYFITLPSLGKSSHFAQLLAVMDSAVNRDIFDYQLYKKSIKDIWALSEPEFVEKAVSVFERLHEL